MTPLISSGFVIFVKYSKVGTPSTEPVPGSAHSYMSSDSSGTLSAGGLLVSVTKHTEGTWSDLKNQTKLPVVSKFLFVLKKVTEHHIGRQ